MGRQQQSNSVSNPSGDGTVAQHQPQSFRRATRAKEAKRTINKVIPDLLATNTRAKKGLESVEFIPDTLSADFAAAAAGGAAAASGGADGGAGGGGRSRRKSSVSAATKDALVKEKEGFKGKSKGKGKRRKGSIDDFDDDDAIAEENAKAAKGGKQAAAAAAAAAALEAPELKIRIVLADTLTVARDLRKDVAAKNNAAASSDQPQKKQNVSKSAAQQARKASPLTILNMASPLRPGGGLLTGANSQEEFLCLRTTLYPSLHEQFYRLPEAGCIWTPDVMVFRSSQAKAVDLPRKDRFYVGVVTAPMLRFPDLEEGASGLEGRYLYAADREIVEKKFKGVLRVMAAKGTRAAVLGAWGCGAYGNPVGETVKIWKKVLLSDVGGKGGKGQKGGKHKEGGGKPDILGQIEEVVFAIKDRKVAEAFAASWGEGIKVEEKTEPVAEEDEEQDPLEKERDELEQKIGELEEQMAQAQFPARIKLVIEGLKKQLADMPPGKAAAAAAAAEEPPAPKKESEGESEEDDEEDDDDDDDDDDEAVHSSEGDH